MEKFWNCISFAMSVTSAFLTLQKKSENFDKNKDCRYHQLNTCIYTFFYIL